MSINTFILFGISTEIGFSPIFPFICCGGEEKTTISCLNWIRCIKNTNHNNKLCKIKQKKVSTPNEFKFNTNWNSSYLHQMHLHTQKININTSKEKIKTFHSLKMTIIVMSNPKLRTIRCPMWRWFSVLQGSHLCAWVCLCVCACSTVNLPYEMKTAIPKTIE